MILKERFGAMPDGRSVEAYTIKNSSGTAVKALSLGATLVSLNVPDRSGKLRDVLLGYDTVEGYLTGDNHLGGTVGRFANRIAKGRFTLDGKQYQVTVNDGENSLHGGSGIDFKLWDVKEDGADALVMTYRSPDGEDGYPGNMTVTLRLSLSEDNALTFEYAATTDAPTLCNLTNHAYFNLNGLKRDVLEHEMWLNSDIYTETDSALIPVKDVPVDGTEYDFRTPRKIGKAIYDTNFYLRGGDGAQATVYDPESGVFMELFTDAPALQVYNSVTLPEQADKGGKRHGVGDGLCLETQLPPDAPNRESCKNYPFVLRPGEVWKSRTTYRFSVK